MKYTHTKLASEWGETTEVKGLPQFNDWQCAHLLQTREHVARSESLANSLENICCESSVGKAFSGSSRLDEIIQSFLASLDDALLPIGEFKEGRVREGVPGSETYSQQIALGSPSQYQPMIKWKTYNVDEIIIKIMLFFVWGALFAVEKYNIEAFLYNLCFGSKDALEKTHCGG